LTEFQHSDNAIRFVTPLRVYLAIRYADTRYWAVTWKIRKPQEKEEKSAFGSGRVTTLYGGYYVTAVEGGRTIGDLFINLDHARRAIEADSRGQPEEAAIGGLGQADQS
jgi:hypothetical protein